MKKLALIFTATICFLSSCQKDLYDPEQAKQNQKMTDLVIPADFNWEMTQNVTSNLTSRANTRVSVFTDSECTNKIGEYTVYSEANEVPIVFNVPSALKELYVQPQGQSAQAVKIENGSINQELIQTTTIRGGKNDDTEDIEEYDTFERQWYTVMFEDMFPKLGDYDFNDFVANYKYSTKWSSKNNPKLESITIDVRINAIGGNLPYSPYLRIEGLNSANNISSITPSEYVERIRQGTDNGNGAGNKSITLKLKNLDFTPKPYEFINTQTDQSIKDPETITITIDFKNGGNNENQVGALDFDFFLANDNGIEIHKKGKKPVLKGNTYPTNIEGGEGNDFYSNEKNYIWAIEIPGEVHHAIEKADFLKAYTGFAKWAETGGVSNPEWYTGSVNTDLIIDLSNKWNE
ncbi:LruC domain-containing protein [Bacteroides sp.]|uniref:LruC domain-containing protein n=1 Tax=Bacteroides sp. TaxID=29523 RepID=UPI0026127483|nr:LruC domain-containing protein [Bacteroides sp.]MDD3036625.1 LruC domain-containing protein [Bacteroides sp.]